VLRQAAGNLVVLARVRGQRRVPFLPLEELYELRDARVRDTVRYAAETVPYYRELFEKERIDPREIRTADDLERLPILEKEVVRAQPERFVSDSRRGRTSMPFVTSGSTGQRLRVFHDRRSLLHNIAYSERHRHVEAELVGRRYRYVKASIGRPSGTGHDVRGFYDRTTWIPLRPRRHSVDMADSVEPVVAALNEIRPDVIRGGGSYLELFFRLVAARGSRLHRPRVVSYGDDVMTPEGKDLIEREFGIPVLSHYNATEAFQIGFLCEERRHFHLHADLTHLTVVGEDGRRLPAGKRGMVVISNLVNRGTVLLKYRLGDEAALIAGSCPCGRPLPMVSQLLGRVEDIVFLPDGRFVHPRYVWDVIKRRPEVVGYQLVQLEPLRFELKLVTGAPSDYEQVAGGIAADVRRLVGPDAAIATSHHEALDRGSRGKLRPVVSLVSRPAE
jgi:phenylacetate-CoA ligase